jgi:hypothetical protein
MLTEELNNKWQPVLEHSELSAIGDKHRRAVTAQLLENTERAISEGAAYSSQHLLGEANYAPANNTTNIDNYDPVLISLVRRSMPNLIAYDICGVQPMTGPTGLIFAMRAKYGQPDANTKTVLGEGAFYNEANTDFSGDPAPKGPHEGLTGTDAIAKRGVGITTADMEANNTFAEMGFEIDKIAVTAKSRALKAEYTTEMAQDLKAIHGLDAETELANILSTEILAEINREVVRTINSQAKIGARQANVTTKGIFDLSSDADGRWSAEKFKGLGVQLDREANVIAKETRRGKGNFIVCSSDVATALAASGMLDYTPALSTNLQVDDTGNTFAGVLNGRIRVYIDPYAVADYINVGYKGTNPYDAGVFYCPYVPLTMVRAVGENDFQPRIGFKTRYGMASNPFVGSAAADGLATVRTNQYYRIFRVDNILT